MNHPPPALGRTHTPAVHPSPEFCPGAPGLTPAFSPRMRNKPNLPHNIQSAIYNIQSPGPISTASDLWGTKNAKRTQSQYGHGMPCPLFQRNEPNLPHALHPPTQKCETNPIPVRARSRRAGMPPLRETNPICRIAAILPTNPPRIIRNEPNSRTGTVPARRDAPITRNKPNLPHRHHPANQSTPNYAKRTQSGYPQRPAAPYFSETNPISPVPISAPFRPCHAAHRSVPTCQETQFAPCTPSADPKMRNEPNPRTAISRTRRKSLRHRGLRQVCSGGMSKELGGINPTLLVEIGDPLWADYEEFYSVGGGTFVVKVLVKVPTFDLTVALGLNL